MDFGKKVLRYLQKTKNYNLVYRRVKNLEVEGYSNADFAWQFPESGKSNSGYVFWAVSMAWKSVKQTQTATSTMMAEYIAVYEATSQGLWLKNFLSQTNLVDSIVFRPLKIHSHNSAVVSFTRNNKRSTNSKHNDLKCCSVREKVKQRTWHC